MLAEQKNDTPFSRSNPSDEYKRLLALYQEHHESASQKNWDKDVYPGKSLWPHLGFMRALTRKYSAQTVMDYGAGKGLQYKNLRVKEAGKNKIHSSVENYWDASVTCYDPGNVAFQKFPEGTFDGVVSTDVLEHCPKDDLAWIIEEMFQKAEKFVFANIACYPAKTILSTGENAHITIENPDWWTALIANIAKNYPDISYYFLATEDRSKPGHLITNDKEALDVPKAGALPGSLIQAYISLIKQKLGR